MRAAIRLIAALSLLLLASVARADDGATTPTPEVDDQAAQADAQQRRDKLRKEIDAIDQLIASFRLLDVPETEERDVTADMVRGLKPRDKEAPDTFRQRVASSLLNRARADLRESTPDRPDPISEQNRALALSSPEMANIVGTLLRAVKSQPPAAPDSCKDVPAGAKTLEEITGALERCASDVETAIKAWNPTTDGPIKEATAALEERKKKVGSEVAKLEQSLRQLSARQTKKIDITESAVKYTVPIVGLLLLLILLAPRVYEPGSQRAIFQNGLLLELMTVYLLIATILLLGLSEKIDKNSLGTLLGGISGYVLGRTIQAHKKRDGELDPRSDDPPASPTPP